VFVEPPDLFWLQLPLLLAGGAMYALGTLGLFRFPNALARLHALTKVDNLGLGLIVLGLLPGASSPSAAAKMLLIWIVALQASAIAAHLVAASVTGIASPPDDDAPR
jgi:multicomponent Na+:H+ antiporter subunit G